MLETKNVSISVEGRRLFTGLSFAAADSETFCIVGRQGGGKTTLLKALMGLHPLDEGHVSIDGELLSQASAQEFRRLLISYVPQSSAMDSAGTVGELASMVFALKANEKKPLPRTLLTEEWGRLGLDADTYSRRLADLDRSERQRVLLAIVCMQNKPIVLADEPLTGLSSETAPLVAAYLHHRAERGQTVVVTGDEEGLAVLRPNNHIVV